MFVHPEQVEASLRALEELDAAENHVLVALEFEQVLRHIVHTLQRRYTQQRRELISPKGDMPPSRPGYKPSFSLGLLHPFVVPIVISRTYIDLLTA